MIQIVLIALVVFGVFVYETIQRLRTPRVNGIFIVAANLEAFSDALRQVQESTELLGQALIELRDQARADTPRQSAMYHISKDLDQP